MDTILNDHSDWDVWLEIRKLCAGQLWKYVDPNTPDAELPILMPPDKPLILQDPAANQNDRAYIVEYEFERSLLKYEQQKRALLRMMLHIWATINPQHLWLLSMEDESEETPHKCLVRLKQRFEPTKAERRKYARRRRRQRRREARRESQGFGDKEDGRKVVEHSNFLTISFGPLSDEEEDEFDLLSSRFQERLRILDR
jgi:hypothetical protein